MYIHVVAVLTKVDVLHSRSTYEGRCSRIKAVVDVTSMSFFFTAQPSCIGVDDVIADDVPTSLVNT